jgi:hypothetical protein
MVVEYRFSTAARRCDLWLRVRWRTFFGPHRWGRPLADTFFGESSRHVGGDLPAIGKRLINCIPDLGGGLSERGAAG